MSSGFSNSCKRNKNPCTRYNKPYAQDNNPSEIARRGGDDFTCQVGLLQNRHI